MQGKLNGESQAEKQAGGGQDLKGKVLKALAAIPGGEALDRYYGISSRNPEQPIWEAGRSAQLLGKLGKAAEGDTEVILDQIVEQGEASFADPDALRALMGRSTVKEISSRENSRHFPTDSIAEDKAGRDCSGL